MKKSIINLIIGIYITVLTFFLMQILSGMPIPYEVSGLYTWLLLVGMVFFLHLVVLDVILIIKVVSERKVEKVKASYEMKQ